MHLPITQLRRQTTSPTELGRQAVYRFPAVAVLISRCLGTELCAPVRRLRTFAWGPRSLITTQPCISKCRIRLRRFTHWPSLYSKLQRDRFLKCSFPISGQRFWSGETSSFVHVGAGHHLEGMANHSTCRLQRSSLANNPRVIQDLCQIPTVVDLVIGGVIFSHGRSLSPQPTSYLFHQTPQMRFHGLCQRLHVVAPFQAIAILCGKPRS